jgi:hypothetical protein
MKVSQLAFALLMALGVARPAFAEDAKSLPTLLIKGEVVSLDTSDPSANQLKVKDRYGFETPIFITKETKVSQGDQPREASSLTSGTPVEVEYNFDVNTAKRHAVSVKVSAPAAAPAAEQATPPASAPAPDASAAPAAPEPAASAPAMPAPDAGPSDPAAAPSAPEAGSSSTY